MTKNGLYLVTGIKKYPAYTGDSTEEWVKLLVPGNDVIDAKKNLETLLPDRIDMIKGVKLLYEGPFDNYIIDLAVA